MSSDNLTGAGNQQERPSSAYWLDALPVDLGNWVAGFVDGEGSFNVPIRRLRSGVFYFEVTTVGGLVDRVFPFFERFPLMERKAKNL